jgi:hypothetical protein
MISCLSKNGLQTYCKRKYSIPGNFLDEMLTSHLSVILVPRPYIVPQFQPEIYFIHEEREGGARINNYIT